MSTGTEGLTLEQYLALPDEWFRDEVSRGRLVREPQPSDRHGEVSVEFVLVLGDYLKSHPVGRLRVASGFRLSRDPLTVRGPDVAFIRNERLAGMQAEPFFEGAPDLAIEVVSPSNTASDLQEKIVEYFEAGTQLVWVVYPRTRSIAVHQPNGNVRMLGKADTLTAPLLLPEFQIPVARLFA